MKRGISSLSFSGSLNKKIDAAAAAGFDGIEIFREDLIYFDGRPSDVSRLARDAGIEIISLQSLRDFEAAPAELAAWNARRADRFLDLAERIGAPLLVVCANTRPDTVSDPARAAADLAALADRAAARGLRLGYEALSTSRIVRSYADAWDIVSRANRPNLGLIVGAVHTLAVGRDFLGVAAIPADRIFLVHMADAPRMKMDAELLSRHFRVFPGQGELPVGQLYERLAGIGYSGYLSLEIFNDQVRAMPPRNVANDGIRAIHLLEETIQPATAAAPMTRDIGFVEIACSGKEARDLKALLGAMGFVHTHSHASLKVSLFRQGPIDIVVNEATEGTAHSFQLLHGLSVFALAFRVDGLPAMTERIRRYQGGEIERHGGPVGPKIPAIRGIGGSFVYLLDGSPDAPDYYEADFRPVSPDPHPAGAGLLSLDHFSQAVVPQEFLSTLLYYRAMFGFEAGAQLDLIDPHGTVRNRNLRSASGRICMSLNASISPSSTTQRLLDKVIGAGFQHFAFLCSDIFGYAKGLDPDLVLQIPANYYDDLGLRFDLVPDVVAAMRQHNILYDRDAYGDYFQIYTHDYNGLFFEVIQRNGYRGFGAVNAPVRMAAQAREYEQMQALAKSIGVDGRDL